MRDTNRDSRPSVVLVGTLDTKADEYDLLRGQLQQSGLDVLVIDVGVLGSPGIRADIPRDQVAREGGAELDQLRERNDRGEAIGAMATGAARVMSRLVHERKVDGLLMAGGSNAGTVFASIAPVLPFGVPKVLLATIVAGQTRPYIGDSDVTLIYPVVDVAGLNVLSRQVLVNAAGALSGMVQARQEYASASGRSCGVVAVTMFGVTTVGATTVRDRLQDHGYEVLVFHANGPGGAAMEQLISQGLVDGVVDLTTTEIADELVGGVCSAGAGRLTAAANAGVAQVVSLGALDMVNFGPLSTVPEAFRTRQLYPHNENVTLMRTSPVECASIGTHIAEALEAAPDESVRVVVPEGGFSAISTLGGVFHDPTADRALIDAVTGSLPNHLVSTSPHDINDPELAREMADSLHHMLSTRRAKPTTTRGDSS